MSAIDYLAIGHVCHDATPQGPRLGGTVTFSALTAQALGLSTAVLTSAPADPRNLLTPLRVLPLEIIPSNDFTTFENIYTPQERTQTLLAHAERLTAEHIPAIWRAAKIVHLAPVANEVDTALTSLFPNALIGITPQGWMRRWDGSGRVFFQQWQPSPELAQRADAVVMSIEDVRGDEEIVGDYAKRFRTLVVTRGKDGCTVYQNGRFENIPAPDTPVVDPTGAGDIFAAVFFAKLYNTGDALAAARMAVRVASASVMRVGLESIPDQVLLHSLDGDK